MWLLGFFSVALATLAVYCFIDFRSKNFYPPEDEKFLEENIASANLQLISERAKSGGTTLVVMGSAVADYVMENGYSGDDNEAHRNLVSAAGYKHNRKRARLVNYFTVIAQAAPMAGLLGTVFGMIKAFSNLGTGVNNPNALAENISEALVTTATGLVIALPAIFLYFFLRDRLEELVSTSEDKATHCIGFLRQAAFEAALREEEELESRSNVYDDSLDIEYEN